MERENIIKNALWILEMEIMNYINNWEIRTLYKYSGRENKAKWN